MGWFYSVNHQIIGTLYLLIGFIGGMFGLINSIFIRLELGTCGNWLSSSQLYNVIVTSHAFLMIFFLVIPILIGGFGNWLLPKMLLAMDLIFPRINNLSF